MVWSDGVARCYDQLVWSGSVVRSERIVIVSTPKGNDYS